MCGIRFIRLEDFINENNDTSGMIIHLEPQGLLFAEVCFVYFIHYFVFYLLNRLNL
jgi:hypothetical protein